jgi:hypothetical protein
LSFDRLYEFFLAIQNLLAGKPSSPGLDFDMSYSKWDYLISQMLLLLSLGFCRRMVSLEELYRDLKLILAVDCLLELSTVV